MVSRYVANLEHLVSPSRLERYRPANRDDLETAVNYLWNVALSESLLQSLSSVEVGLRNAVHSSIGGREGSDYWFWGFLTGTELDHFNREWAKLTNAQRKLPTAGKVVAQQSFGFWHKVFEPKYGSDWEENKSALLWATFPHHPRVGVEPAQWLTRKKIQTRVKLFLDLRNRAMHHEPIFQGLARPDEMQPGLPTPMTPLEDIHTQMYEFLGWIHPDLVLSLQAIDRFIDVYNGGRADVESRLRAEIVRVYGTL